MRSSTLRIGLVAGVVAAAVALFLLLRGSTPPPETPPALRVPEETAEPPASPAGRPQPDAPAPAEILDAGAVPDEPVKPRKFEASIRAGRISGPWMAIRQQVMGSNDAEDLALSKDIHDLVLALREQRRAPDEEAWRGLLDRMDLLASRVRASRHGASPIVQKALAQVEGLRRPR